MIKRWNVSVKNTPYIQKKLTQQARKTKPDKRAMHELSL